MEVVKMILQYSYDTIFVMSIESKAINSFLEVSLFPWRFSTSISRQLAIVCKIVNKRVIDLKDFYIYILSTKKKGQEFQPNMDKMVKNTHRTAWLVVVT